MKCNKCSNANICLDHIEILSLSGCTSGIPDRKVPTNADKIRTMSDEELAELLFNKSRCDNCFANCNDKDNCPSLGSCYSRHLEWLQSEVKRPRRKEDEQ